VRSPIAFYQMIGPRMRLDPPSSKTHVRVYDYTDATRLFGETFIKVRASQSGGARARAHPEPQPIIQVEDLRST